MIRIEISKLCILKVEKNSSRRLNYKSFHVVYSVSGPERIIYLQLTIDLCQVLGGAFRQESMPGGVGIHEGLGETGWIVAKDMDEYMETFNRLEISGGKVTGWHLISYHET